MSLTGKQVRELQSLYESVYAEKPEKEDVVLTQEDFDQLCLVILQEAFESSGVEIFEGRKKLTLIQKGYRHIVKPAIDYIKKNKVQLGTSAAVGGAGVGEITTGGTNIKHGGAMLNNLGSFVKDTRTMSNQNQQGAGMLMKDKETGTFSTAQQVRDKVKKKEKLNNSFEFNNFNLHIVEDAKSLEDLTKELNKQKSNKKDNTNINTNIKSDKPEVKTDKPEVKIDKPEVKTDKPEVKIDKPEVKTDKPEVKVDTSKVDTSKEIESSEAEFKANEGEKFNKFQNEKIKKEKADAKKKADDKKHADAKKKDKLLSTHIPIVSKTKLGSTVRPVKPGSARDNMIAKNELRHGSDHIVKLRKKNADFQRMKKGEISKADFIAQYPNSQTAKKAKMKKLNMSYEPYHIVLGYVLSEGHADTVEEAHYIMTQMDGETIQEIVALDEGVVANTARLAGALTLGGLGLKAIKDMQGNKNKMDKGGKFTPGSTMDNIQKRNQMLKDM